MRGDNPIADENRRRGTRDWVLQRPALAREIEGYASATSVNRGEAIHFYVNTIAPSYELEVFRMGWYESAGARRVFGPARVRGTLQPMPTIQLDSGLIECAWINPFVLTTSNIEDAQAWVSGVYLAKLTASGSEAQSYIIFVVRDDERRADLLYQQSVTTYQAYNAWGDKSLYKWGSSEAKRASKVSFDRPYAANAQNPAAAYGVGAGEFLTNLQPHHDSYRVSNAGWEYNMVRWLERECYDVTYCTNLDVHARSDLLLNYKGFLSVGHDEYWSWQMRDHIEMACDAGVNLAVFGANAAYWQVRFESSEISGATDRVMVCCKRAERDPIGANNARATDKWRKPPINRPEQQLIGVMYVGDPVDGDIIVSAPEHWLYMDTSLTAGSVLRGLLGYEVDCVHEGFPQPGEIVAISPWQALNDPSLRGVAHMTSYTTARGATVFATGSIQWAWGLDDFNVPILRTSRLSPAAQQITRNVLRRFGAG